MWGSGREKESIDNKYIKLRNCVKSKSKFQKEKKRNIYDCMVNKCDRKLDTLADRTKTNVREKGDAEPFFF